MKINNKGFAHLKPILLLLFLILAIVGAFLIVKIMQTNNLGPFSLSHTSVSEECKEKDGLRMCLSSSRAVLSSSETFELKTNITNNTDSDISHTFGCTFTDPFIILNDENIGIGLVCGQAITTRVIKANSSESIINELTGSELKTGNNTLRAIWGPFESGTLIVQREDQSSEETADQFEACQNLEDNIEFDDVPHYCDSINIILKGSDDDQYSCEDWKNIFEEVKLSIPCTPGMAIGVGFIYVPRNDSERYAALIESLPEVDSAFVDVQ